MFNPDIKTPDDACVWIIAPITVDWASIMSLCGPLCLNPVVFFWRQKWPYLDKRVELGKLFWSDMTENPRTCFGSDSVKREPRPEAYSVLSSNFTPNVTFNEDLKLAIYTKSSLEHCFLGSQTNWEVWSFSHKLKYNQIIFATIRVILCCPLGRVPVWDS